MENNRTSTGHISTSYSESISEIKSLTLEMAGLVEASYSNALSGLIKAEIATKTAANPTKL